jgi:hypothetical protein
MPAVPLMKAPWCRQQSIQIFRLAALNKVSVDASHLHSDCGHEVRVDITLLHLSGIFFANLFLSFSARPSTPDTPHEKIHQTVQADSECIFLDLQTQRLLKTENKNHLRNNIFMALR